jgi:hypothetical protein
VETGFWEWQDFRVCSIATAYLMTSQDLEATEKSVVENVYMDKCV